MNARELAALKEAVEAKYRALSKQLQEERLRELEAIEIVAGLVTGASTRSLAAAGPPAAGGRRPSVIAEAIASFRGDFTIKDIQNLLENSMLGRKVSRNSLNSALRRMKERGELVVVVQGVGRTPTVYRKT